MKTKIISTKTPYFLIDIIKAVIWPPFSSTHVNFASRNGSFVAHKYGDFAAAAEKRVTTMGDAYATCVCAAVRIFVFAVK
jgi:hypothetical protein